MQSVGHHLQVEAIKKSGTERDLFARSAFNRYYYAAFLAVRQLLSELDPKWAELPHKSYPELLKGTIRKNYRTAMTRATKNRDFELVQILDSGIRAAMALAKLMETANATRVIADYKPAEPINFSTAKRFSLKGIEISEAHDWNKDVRMLVNSIREAWKQVNV